MLSALSLPNLSRLNRNSIHVFRRRLPSIHPAQRSITSRTCAFHNIRAKLRPPRDVVLYAMADKVLTVEQALLQVHPIDGFAGDDDPASNTLHIPPGPEPPSLLGAAVSARSLSLI